MNKWKDILSDGINFLLNHKRYLVSSGLVIITVLVLSSSDDKKVRLFPELKKKVQTTVDKEEIPKIETNLTEEELNPNPLILNEDKGLNDFIKNYYKSLATADIDKIRECTDVLSESEISSIKLKAKASEEYKNIKVYTKNGPEDDSYLAYVYVDLKFKNIKTMVPGVEPYYIKKEADGFVIINSQNSPAEDLEFTSDMDSAEDTAELFEKANEAYKEACAKDKELLQMLKENGFPVPDISKEDAEEDNKDKPKTETTASSETASNSTTTSTEKPAKNKPKESSASSSKSNEVLVGKTYVLTDGMRLREKKSTKSGVVASAIKDDTVTVLTIYDDSSWVKVELYSNMQKFTGYMKKDMLLSNSKIKK